MRVSCRPDDTLLALADEHLLFQLTDSRTKTTCANSPHKRGNGHYSRTSGLLADNAHP